MSDTFVNITRIDDLGMITLRMDLADDAACTALQTALGADMPGRHEMAKGQKGDLLWMSPDELMILCPKGQVADLLPKLTHALTDVHHLLADVSDARAVFDLRGDMLRGVLAKLTPTNIHPDAFATGQVRRTRLGQVAAAVWLPDTDTARVICFRSVGDYMAQLLQTAASKESQVYV
ncbi:MAG: sarcosine oxidase subunit gamma [Planktomarina sp.]